MIDDPPVEDVANLDAVLEQMKAGTTKARLRIRESEVTDRLHEFCKGAAKAKVTPQARERIIKSIRALGDDSPWIAGGFVLAGGLLGFILARKAGGNEKQQLVAALGGGLLGLATFQVWRGGELLIDFSPADGRFLFVFGPATEVG